MIKHIVFFGIVEEAAGRSKMEIMQFIKKELENLIHSIPELKKIEVGINHPDAPLGNYDLVLYSEFDSMADLDAYQVHPEHKRVASYIGTVKVSRACVDYEV
ncbi:MAG: Dabb family protein [Paludibacter sp.]|nr:Dabb family protein [Paludibacter sp.]